MKSYDELKKELDIYNNTIFRILDKEMQIRAIQHDNPNNIKEYLLNNVRNYLDCSLQMLNNMEKETLNYSIYKDNYEEKLMIYNKILKEGE